MSNPTEFVFQPPKGKQDQDALLSTLSFQFSQVSTEQEEHTRLVSFQQTHSPQARLSSAATQQARRLRALELQKRVKRKKRKREWILLIERTRKKSLRLLVLVN